MQLHSCTYICAYKDVISAIHSNGHLMGSYIHVVTTYLYKNTKRKCDRSGSANFDKQKFDEYGHTEIY